MRNYLLGVLSAFALAAAVGAAEHALPNYTRLIEWGDSRLGDSNLLVVTFEGKQTIYLNGLLIAEDRIKNHRGKIVFEPIPGAPNSEKKER